MKKLSKRRCHFQLLKVLASLDKQDLSELMGHITDQCINHVCELVANITLGSLPAPKKIKKQLRKVIKARDYMYISNPRRPCHRRRLRLKTLAKGGLSLLLKKALPLLKNLIST